MESAFPDNIVTAWIEAETKRGDLPLASAIDRLNKATGRHYRHSRIREWEDGRYTPSPEVLRYMSERVAESLIPEILGCDISTSVCHLIANVLSPPIKRSTQRQKGLRARPLTKD